MMVFDINNSNFTYITMVLLDYHIYIALNHGVYIALDRGFLGPSFSLLDPQVPITLGILYSVTPLSIKW